MLWFKIKKYQLFLLMFFSNNNIHLAIQLKIYL